MSKGMVILLRSEGFAVLLISVFLYRIVGQSWFLFALLFLVPDVSIFGYGGGNQLGAVIYNIFHSYVIPLALGAFGLWYKMNAVVAISLIWTAHIGFDRSLGYGLRYPNSFNDTHLGRIGG